MKGIVMKHRFPVFVASAFLPLLFLGFSSMQVLAEEPETTDRTAIVEPVDTESVNPDPSFVEPAETPAATESSQPEQEPAQGSEEELTSEPKEETIAKEDILEPADATTAAVNELKVAKAPAKAPSTPSVPDVYYKTHVQTYGWQGQKTNGQMSGTSGQSKRLEAIQIRIGNTTVSGNIEYRTHIQTYGWEGVWKKNGQSSGTSGQSKRLEAIQIRLTGDLANYYDVYYCVHAQTYGWLDWAKNGECAGTAGQSKRLEGIKILLVSKGAAAPKKVGWRSESYVYNKVSYSTHIQGIGWQAYRSDGALSGTTGQSRRIEAIKIKVMGPNPGSDLGVKYQAHVQSIGWQSERANNQVAGTSGQSKRVEALTVNLTGKDASKYDIYYTVHVQGIGWLGWAKNGQAAGTSGASRRVEGIRIEIVDKGASAPKNIGPYSTPYVNAKYNVTYQVSFTNSVGFNKQVGNGANAGKEGKVIDTLKMNLDDSLKGTLLYRTYSKSTGWGAWKKDNEISGFDNKQMEAVQVKIDDDIAKLFDIYYRTGIDGWGWFAWSKNGASNGTQGVGQPVSSFEACIQLRGSGPANSKSTPFLNADKMTQKAQNYGSATNYMVLVDKSQYLCGVYQRSGGKWKLVQATICGIGKDATPTIEGQFTTGPYHNIVHRRNEYDYWYITQFHGDWLFHSCLFVPGQSSPVKLNDPRMGIKVSHGCVRLPLDMAKRVYHLPSGSRVVVYR